jgi:hypothetical protein
MVVQGAGLALDMVGVTGSIPVAPTIDNKSSVSRFVWRREDCLGRLPMNYIPTD